MKVEDIEFGRAHAAATRAIRKQYLTVRIAADPINGYYEVWQRGNFVRIDDYTEGKSAAS